MKWYHSPLVYISLSLVLLVSVFPKSLSMPALRRSRSEFARAPTTSSIHASVRQPWTSSTFGGYKVLEGDMLVADETQAAQAQVQNSGIVFQQSRWPNAYIPYVISSDFGAWERDIIYGAMNEISGSSCVRFQERKGWEGGHGHYVFIQKHYGRVCNSVVGRTLAKTPQIMTLGDGCVNHWTVLHELVHAIGFYHEQNRWDRDNYISVLWDNIPQAHHHDFQKQGNSYDFGVGYDYKSIMHYASTHFGYAGRQTLESRPPGISFGNARHLSFKDKLKINRMYSCYPNSNSVQSSAAPSTAVSEPAAAGSNRVVVVQRANKRSPGPNYNMGHGHGQKSHRSG